VKARLEVCRRTWLPLDLTLPVCGDIEKTTYSDFGLMQAAERREASGSGSGSGSGEDLNGFGACEGVMYPRHTIQVASGGGKNEYWARSLRVRDVADREGMAFDVFGAPEVPLFPPDTTFEGSEGEGGGRVGEVDYIQAKSGHILVKPVINGVAISGMMILDTGASGFVITKRLADELGMGAFGELYVAGVTQKVKSQFRRADHIQLGPVRMRRPLFMEMNIDGVVHGAPEPVVGILGYDFFRRCVVEMPPLAHPPALRSGFVPASQLPRPRNKIVVHDPTTYHAKRNEGDCKEEEGKEGGLVWKELQLVANVPHIHATFCKENGVEHSALFMLDSGAGGAGIMFHARASEEFKLLESKESMGNSKSIRGIGGESSAGGMRVYEGNMRYLQVSGARFENVLSLIAMGGGFDLSLHTAGMICADLMVKCRVIFDYPRRRFAMIQEDDNEEEENNFGPLF